MVKKRDAEKAFAEEIRRKREMRRKKYNTPEGKLIRDIHKIWMYEMNRKDKNENWYKDHSRPDNIYSEWYHDYDGIRKFSKRYSERNRWIPKGWI